MDDCISRDEAIDNLCEICFMRNCSHDCDAVKAIRKTKPADVRPVVHGNWKDVLFGWECTACHEKNEYSVLFRFCPNCGADMREVDADG